MSELTHERLLELLRYDPETGDFYWLVANSNRSKAGAKAGWFSKASGYWKLNIDGCRYQAHRVAFFYMKGRWPDPECDHRDSDGSNNRWLNLREATRSENGGNTRVRSDSTIGIKGVKRSLNRYKARITKNGVVYYLGSFDTAEEAGAAYARKAKELFGEFARAA
jgi:hypothetical protein